MGKRILSLDTQILANVFKQNRYGERSWIVEDHPLPDDAKVIGLEVKGYLNGDVDLILESEAWWGDCREPLPHPVVRLYEKEAEHATGT